MPIHEVANIVSWGWDANDGTPLYRIVCECRWISEPMKNRGSFLNVKETIRAMDKHRNSV